MLKGMEELLPSLSRPSLDNGGKKTEHTRESLIKESLMSGEIKV